MQVPALIGIMISIVIGISVIPMIIDTTNQIEKNYENTEDVVTPGEEGFYSELDELSINDNSNKELIEKEEIPSTLKNMLGALPYIFVSVLILGIVIYYVLYFRVDEDDHYREGDKWLMNEPERMNWKQKIIMRMKGN